VAPQLRRNPLGAHRQRNVTNKTTGGLLASAEQTLATARAGFEDLTGPMPERRLSGLRNLVVFGRAVTNVLQNLRSTEPGFDEWYAPLVREMESDPLLRFVYKLRSEILKEGTVPTSVSAHIRHLDFPGDFAKFGPPPPNARSFFIGDQNGGSGWEVALPDGRVDKYYAALPGDVGQVSVHLVGAPTEHLGQQLSDGRLETVCAAYLSYLERLLAQAKLRFGGGA